ncbi:hypothetical protein MMC27_002751 [Xylographa pallens]|nr:hypothetical protein [Xylographa pallens]
MASAHESMFSYGINRPYPFKWLTPVVLAGSLVATALFSFLNFASSGYDLVVQTSSDPNTTISKDVGRRWQPKRPAFADVLQQCHQQCTASSIEVDLEALDRAANQVAFSEWGASVRAYITCTIETATGQTSFNLTTTYDYVPETVAYSSQNQFLGTNFLGRDKGKRASLYWGESLMSMYWAYLTRPMLDIRANVTAFGIAGIRKGTISFTRDNSFVSNITSLNFFDVQYRFIIDQGLDDSSFIFQVSTKANSLVKSTYSTILMDLGQVSSMPNILTDRDTLQYFTSNFSLALQHVANAVPGPATQDYTTLGASTCSLGVTPSVINANYICQLPQLKSAAVYFWQYCVADLVFLQAIRNIFVLATGWLLRENPSANQCQGCIGLTSGHQTPLPGSVDHLHEGGVEQIELNAMEGSSLRLSSCEA